jgi:hypothetical protein
MKLFLPYIALAASATAAAPPLGFVEFDGSASLYSSNKSSGLYARELTLELPGVGEVDLKANLALLSPDWHAETWDPITNARFTETSQEKFNCHYLGVVRGFPGSVAAISVCDGLGIQGSVRLDGQVSLEIQPVAGGGNFDPARRVRGSLGTHMLYNTTNMPLPQDVFFGGVDAPPAEATGGKSDDSASVMCSDFNDSCPAWANRGECDINPSYMLQNCQLSCGVCTPGDATYMNDVVYASDRNRVNRLGSQGELQDTIALNNRVQSYYSSPNNQWRMAQPNNRIRVQLQNPPQWDQNDYGESNEASVAFLERCRASNLQTQGDNLHCLQELARGFPGNVGGWGYTGAMCGTYSVGWNAMLPNDDRWNSLVVAHEMGHNYGFDHSSDSTIMGNYQNLWFGSQSVNQWDGNRFACLR